MYMKDNRLVNPAWLLCGLFLLYLNACMSSRSEKEAVIRHLIKVTGERYVPDSRTGIFDIRVNRNVDNWVLDGVTDHPEIVDILLDSLEQRSLPYINKIRILPGDELEDRIRGLVSISVANLRSDPSHAAELCTQALMGTPLKLLRKERGWYQVQTPDQYLGWVDEEAIITMDKEAYEDYRTEAKIIYTALWGNSYGQPDRKALPVSDLVAGGVLQLIEIQGDYYKVKYPDGRLAFVNRSESEPFVEWVDDRNPTSENLVSTAEKLIGIPYLWGGTSIKAVDCSGFTKTVYFMNGLILPRDASQQDDIGMFVDDQKFFSRLLPGDLLFFGTRATDSTEERVVHVGLWIGNMRFIHASGDVHISSMDPDDPLFDQYNLNRYLKTKRLLNSQYIDQLFIRRYY
jgi:cell wall-associated NlpC family hydrolase